MESITTKTEVQNIDNTNPISDIKPTHALVTNVEFSDGKTTNVVTLFNCADLKFEEMNLGVNTAIERHEWLSISESNSSLYRFDNGNLKKVIEWEKHSYIKKYKS